MSRSLIQKSAIPYWLGLCALLGFLGVAVWQLLEIQRVRLEIAAHDQSVEELQLLRSFVHDALQKYSYQSIEKLFGEWGGKRRDTVSIRLLADNGFVIGRYVREQAAPSLLRLTEEIPYSYRNTAILELIKDQSGIERGMQGLRMEFGLLAGAVALILCFMTWSVFRGKQEELTLQDHARELNLANERLDQTSKELDRLRVYLKGIVDSVPSVLIGVDIDGRVNEWNQAAEKATRIKGEDARGQFFTDLMPHLGGQQDKVMQAINEGRPLHATRLTTVVGGVVRYSNLLVNPLNSEVGRGAVIRVDDVTQRVRFEQMMVQNEKMLSLSGLAAGVAHEINNPLSGVLQNCQNITRRLSSDLTSNRLVAEASGIDLTRLQDYLERRKIPGFLRFVREAAERASHIVTDMLAFSRHGTESFDKVALCDLLDTALRLASSDYDMKKTYDFRRIDIEQKLEPGLPLLHCDHTRLEQVLLNLLKNSAQAMTQANTPAPRKISLRARVEADWVLIQLEDNGPGMSAEVKQCIFEPFYTTKGRGLGTGLGLSVAYFIVTEQHRGEIEVISAPGKGTRFEIRLPLAKPAATMFAGFSRAG